MGGVFYVAISVCTFHDLCVILIRALVEYMFDSMTSKCTQIC
jgi:hypothetical protein